MKYNRMKIVSVVVLMMAMVFSQSTASAATSEESENTKSGLYAGLEGGAAFGVSTFTSFAADKTRPGYTAGFFVGYQFNPVLSVEMDAKWGNLQLAARQSCVDANYWLAADGAHYTTAIPDREGDYFSNVKTSTYWQSYGLRLNVNVLGFVPSLRDSRWKLEVSPQISVLGPQSKVKRLSNGETIGKLDSQNWLWGYGGNIQASYNLPAGLMVGVYSGVTFVKGGCLDVLQKGYHKENFVWESGVRVGWRF